MFASFDIITLILGFLVFVYSVILHEIAHGLVAERLGDPTARKAGRLTLNPIPHIDPMMTIAMPLVLFILSRISGLNFIIGAAKPVPVNPLYFDDPKKDMAIVAAAGALTNFGLAALGAVCYHFVGPSLPFLAGIFVFMVTINIFLGVFNLVPIPPLDGSKVLASFLSRQSAAAFLSLEPYGFFILLFLFAMPTGFSSLIGQVVAVILTFLQVP